MKNIYISMTGSLFKQVFHYFKSFLEQKGIAFQVPITNSN